VCYGFAPMLPLVLAATAAAAAAVPLNAPPPSPDLDRPARLRSGVVVGLTLGGGVAGASGYPNSSSDIGNPAFYSASGFMGGGSGTFFVMGALSDYLSFGFWFGSGTFQNSDWHSTGGGGGLRVELFPFVGLFPRLGGLGLLGEFGIGSAKLTSKNPEIPEANGTQSVVGAGAFYEWSFGRLFGGHFAFGPSLEYDAIFSQPFERHGLVGSARIVFYGGP
jgi:hypothetical protein